MSAYKRYYYKKGGKGIYKKCERILPSLFDKVYVNESDLPIKQRYAEAYAERLSEIDKEKLNGKTYNPEKFRTTVSRTIDSLVEAGKMTDVGDKGKYFVPNNAKYRRYLKRRKIIDNVKFCDEDILVINKKIVAISILSKESSDNFIYLFKDYLEDDCFSVEICGNTLLVFLRKNEKETIEVLKKLAKEAYLEQNGVNS